MEQLWTAVHYLRDHLGTAVGGGLALFALRWLLNRKSKLTRQMERRLAELRNERPSIYKEVRPLGGTAPLDGGPKLD
jgi:hypothetical protein